MILHLKCLNDTFRGNAAAAEQAALFLNASRSVAHSGVKLLRGVACVCLSPGFLVGTTTKPRNFALRLENHVLEARAPRRASPPSPVLPRPGLSRLCVPEAALTFPPKTNRAASLSQSDAFKHQIRWIFRGGGAQHVCARLVQRRKRISHAVISCNRRPHQNYVPCW